MIDSIIHMGPVGFVPKDSINYNLLITGSRNRFPFGHTQFCINGCTPQIGQIYVQDRPINPGNVWRSDIGSEAVNSSIVYQLNLNSVSMFCC